MIEVSGYMAAWQHRADWPIRYPEVLHIKISGTYMHKYVHVIFKLAVVIKFMVAGFSLSD